MLTEQQIEQIKKYNSEIKNALTDGQKIHISYLWKTKKIAQIKKIQTKIINAVSEFINKNIN
jgi:hypothetical protein